MKKYMIWCQVSGGVTGTRGSWLKSDGNTVYFQTRLAAEMKAHELNNRVMHCSHRAHVEESYSA